MGTKARVGATIVALAVTGATLAHAAAGAGSEDRLLGCVLDTTGALRVVEDAEECRPQEHLIEWNVLGRPGPEGPTGPTGPPGVVGSIDELDGTPCNGGGTLSILYAPSGAATLACTPPTTTTTTRAPSECGSLAAFDPRTNEAWDDYPILDETEADQYRSYLEPSAMYAVQYAARTVALDAAEWDGNGGPIGLGDMSECDGSIPGTSTGAPAHPAGTHTDGYDIDVAYFQTGTPDNRLRSVCPTAIDRVEQHHCVGEPDLLDVGRTALFVEALASTGGVRVIGVDGRIGPLLEAELQSLCDTGVTDCTPVPLAYETTDTGEGWYRFHHHHMHVGFVQPRR
jgi:hypothetical protein